mgnify:CR=1 FL=1
MKQGWLFATRKNRTLFSNCKRRIVQEEKRNRQAMAEDPPRQIPKRNEIEL